MSGWGNWYHLAGPYIGRDHFTEGRHSSVWFFGDWRLGIVVHGFQVMLLILPQRPLIEFQIGWTRSPGWYQIDLGWFHAQTRVMGKWEDVDLGPGDELEVALEKWAVEG